MSTTKQLPPLTPELIEAAKAYPNIEQHQVNLLRAYRDQWKPNRLVVDAAIHILTRALSAHRRIPMGGTKVGDLVRACYPTTPAGKPQVAFHGYEVRLICPFRGVMTAIGWHRSWVRVKGGAS